MWNVFMMFILLDLRLAMLACGPLQSRSANIYCSKGGSRATLETELNNYDTCHDMYEYMYDI